MKHCAKKLLGLAFALALCLAVGGTAFAVEAPEFADVPAALPEQEMMDYEPNVTAEPGTKTIDKLATEGYQVTIPTTVTVKSGENTGELEVTASVKQLRTLKITLDSTNSWQLKHESGPVLAGYSLKAKNPNNYEVSGQGFWMYNEDGTTEGKKKPELYLQVGQKASGVSDITWSESFTVPMIVEVTDPSQATMSGTYTDTVSFEFDLTKRCFTYIINVYGQKVELTDAAHGTSSDFGKKYKGLQAVNMAGNANAPYTEQYVLEYGVNPNGTVMGAAPGPWQHNAPTAGETRKAVDGTEKTFTAEEAADYALRWETLDPVTIDPATDYANGDKTKTKTIDLNLVRKWYWLDVNGATDYTGGTEDIHGNQGGSISGCVNMKVSVDGQDWSNWFWQSDGDDYWGQFPYGIQFKLGFHHVKDGYVYEMSGNGVKIIANGTVDQTKPGAEETGTAGYTTTYYVYEGTLTGEPIDKTSNNGRYCYIPCYKKGITYFANGGTGGKEDVNEDNPPRTNVLYDKTGTLKTPDELDIHAPTGKTFLWWSTKPTYTAGTALYKAEANVENVQWETYTSAEMSTRPTGDDQKRELYAIWETPYTVKVQFGDEKGYTTWDAANQSFPEKGQGGDNFDEPAVALGTAYTYDNTSLTLSETENRRVWEALQTKITEKTREIAPYDRPEDVWQLKDEYTFTTLPANREVIIKIKRKRHLLNVIPALQNDTGGYTPAPDRETAGLYGIFDLKSCDVLQTRAGKVSSYQSMRNYGSSYEIYNVEAKPGYLFVGFFKVPSGGGFLTEADGTGNMTGQNDNISYFGDTSGREYTGDTIYVMFKKDTVTFDFNGGTNQEGETKTKVQYFPDSYIQPMLYNSPGTSSFIGWSLNKKETPNETIYHPNITQLGSIPWTDPETKVLYARWSTGPSHAPAKKALTVRYHANFDPNEALALDLDPNPLLEDMDDDFGFEPDPLPEDVLDPTEGAVKTVIYKPDENVVLRHCMFKRAGYVFVGWNTEKDGTGKKYEVNGVPITDWAAGATVDLYAQWEKPHHMKPVDDSAPQLGGADATPTPQPGGADPAPQPGGMDDAFGVDPHLGGMDDAFGVDPAAQPEGMDDAFGVDPAAQPKALDDAFGVDPDPQPEELDDAFGV